MAGTNGAATCRVDEDARWRAVRTRDATFDGAFFYGVRSTNIYCKPSCPSRKPLRERVEFFPSVNEAESAGFRACRRCAPREAATPDPRIVMVVRACRLIERATDASPSLADLSRQLGVSRHHLQRTFKSVTGVTPLQYSAARRLEKFKSQIRSGGSVSEAIYDAGYGSSSRLYEKAPEQLGMTPATYARGGAGMKINYTITDSPLGKLLVAGTARGICAITLGDSEDELASALRKEYPKADVRPDDSGLAEAVERLLNYLGGDERALDLPLDLRATAFQLRVWEELRRIPFGDTRSYREVAEGLGQPKAVRAVARACATNPVALVTPCHRVVREDGSLSGYRWGTERKAKLLAQERAAADKNP
jgi:AraC family transcriptional regulator of adaptative response/methylated-DNA-[protein]-cysteine methyltransferase